MTVSQRMHSLRVRVCDYVDYRAHHGATIGDPAGRETGLLVESLKSFHQSRSTMDSEKDGVWPCLRVEIGNGRLAEAKNNAGGRGPVCVSIFLFLSSIIMDCLWLLRFQTVQVFLIFFSQTATHRLLAAGPWWQPQY